jgi:hypothetical protein
MANLPRGANRICTFTLYASDGSTPAPVSGFAAIVAVVIQFRKVVATYELGTDTEIREGSSTNIVEVEIDTTLSASLKEGVVSVKLLLDTTDADFTEDGFQRCIPEEDAFTVV